MFERFTDQAPKVIMLAQEETRRLQHKYVGSEQILLGLMGEDTNITVNVLKQFDIDLKAARVEVTGTSSQGQAANLSQ